MPVWNGCGHGKERYLRKAIDSIIDQTFSNWEMIIVDDGSTDATPQVLKEYKNKDSRIKVVRHDTNLKIVRALNHGLDLCQAPLVARQDSDDYSTVTRLELQKKFMDERPKTAMCGTGMYVVNEEDKLVMEIVRVAGYKAVKEALTKMCPFVHGSVMFRKEAVQAMGGYSTDPRYEYAEDYELWVRLAAKHVIENMPDTILYFHRNHGNKSSVVYRNQQEAATRLIISSQRG